jgi:hypothetical protein
VISEKNMTDSFEARGDFLPEAIAADNNDTGFNAAPDFSDAPEATPLRLTPSSPNPMVL